MANPPLPYSNQDVHITCIKCGADLLAEVETLRQHAEEARALHSEPHSDLLECPECGYQMEYHATPVQTWDVDIVSLQPPQDLQIIPFEAAK